MELLGEAFRVGSFGSFDHLFCFMSLSLHACLLDFLEIRFALCLNAKPIASQLAKNEYMVEKKHWNVFSSVGIFVSSMGV